MGPSGRLHGGTGLRYGTARRRRGASRVGEAEFRDEQTYGGAAIIRCARLRDHARGGQLLVSAATVEIAADRLPPGASLVPVGEAALRGLPRAERVHQLVHEGLAAPVADLRPRRDRLGTWATPLIGRVRERQEVGALIEDARMVTITGVGGAGKTRLAHAVAADLDRHGAEVVWIELARVSSSADVEAAVAAACGAGEAPRVDLGDVLVAFLQAKEVLLVFDNCEHLLDSCAALADQILRRTPQTHLLCADRVWDGVSPESIPQGFVVIDDGLITAVGRQANLGSRFDSVHRLDLPGATVLPGLINGHVHLTFSASPTPVEDYLADAAAGPCVLTLRAVANLEAAARAGVTTVRDLGTRNDVALAVREAAATGRITSPRVITSGEPITVTGGHCHWFSHQCDTEADIRRAVRRQACTGADLVKIFATGGNLTPRTNPFAPQFTADELRACVEEAARLGLPVAAHAHAPEGIRRAVAAGASTIEHCFFETAGGVEFDPAVADAMAEARIAFCPTLGAGIRRTLAEPASANLRRIRSRLPLILQAMRSLLAAGVPLLAGSDAGVTNHPFGDFPADIGFPVGEAGHRSPWQPWRRRRSTPSPEPTETRARAPETRRAPAQRVDAHGGAKVQVDVAGIVSFLDKPRPHVPPQSVREGRRRARGA